MDAPAVSIVLPVWNREGTVRAAIDSVLGQGFGDLELIVVDDGSTDGSVAAVQAVKDARLRLIRHPVNRGAGAARNTGIDAARAPVVAFQDSDDLWRPAFLERLLAALAAQPAAVAAYAAMVIDGAQPGRDRLPPLRQNPVDGMLYEALLRRNFISTQMLAARTGALRQAGGFDTDLPALEDWDLLIRLAALGPFAHVPEVLVEQRFSANSITRSGEKRLRAQEMVMARHANALAARPGVLAFHHRRLAGGYRRAGDMAMARHHATAALRLRPLDPRLWALRGWLVARGLLPGD